MHSHYQRRVAELVASGASIDHIDDTVIAPAPLTAEAKAALWLYAWSFQPVAEQRRVALEGLAAAAGA